MEELEYKIILKKEKSLFRFDLTLALAQLLLLMLALVPLLLYIWYPNAPTANNNPANGINKFIAPTICMMLFIIHLTIMIYNIRNYKVLFNKKQK